MGDRIDTFWRKLDNGGAISWVIDILTARAFRRKNAKTLERWLCRRNPALISDGRKLLDDLMSMQAFRDVALLASKEVGVPSSKPIAILLTQNGCARNTKDMHGYFEKMVSSGEHDFAMELASILRLDNEQAGKTLRLSCLSKSLPGVGQWQAKWLEKFIDDVHAPIIFDADNEYDIAKRWSALDIALMNCVDEVVAKALGKAVSIPDKSLEALLTRKLPISDQTILALQRLNPPWHGVLMKEMPNRTQEERLRAFLGLTESISLAKKLRYAMDTIKAEEQFESIQRNTPSIPEGGDCSPPGVPSSPRRRL